MKTQIYAIIQNSRVDGPGIRMVVEFQGCLLHCGGCSAQGAWNPNAGTEMDTEELKRRMAIDLHLDGITLSGGEPFLQPAAAYDLAKFAHSLDLSVWCFTGYTMDSILQKGDGDQQALLREVDVLVDGPYRADKYRPNLRFRASENQRILDVPKSLAGDRLVWYEDDF